MPAGSLGSAKAPRSLSPAPSPATVAQSSRIPVSPGLRPLSPVHRLCYMDAHFHKAFKKSWLLPPKRLCGANLGRSCGIEDITEDNVPLSPPPSLLPSGTCCFLFSSRLPPPPLTVLRTSANNSHAETCLNSYIFAESWWPKVEGHQRSCCRGFPRRTLICNFEFRF